MVLIEGSDFSLLLLTLVSAPRHDAIKPTTVPSDSQKNVIVFLKVSAHSIFDSSDSSGSKSTLVSKSFPFKSFLIGPQPLPLIRLHTGPSAAADAMAPLLFVNEVVEIQKPQIKDVGVSVG